MTIQLFIIIIKRYVKHHAARILVYLGLEKRLRNKVYLFDLLEETLIANNLISAQNQATPETVQQSTNLQSNVQQSNLQTNQAHFNDRQHPINRQQSKPTVQQNDKTNLLQCNEENAYICMTSLPPLNIYKTIENQQLLTEKAKFEQTKSIDKESDKQLFKHILNELDFEPKLVSSSVESIILQLLQQIENRLNDGENEDEINEINENVKLGIDPAQFKTIFDIVEQMIQDKQIQERIDEQTLNEEQNNLFKDQNASKDEIVENKQTDQINQNVNSQDQENGETIMESKQTTGTKFLFNEQQTSIDQNTMNFNNQKPPPSIQVDFISSDRSSPRRSSSQRSSLNAEEANEAAKLAKEKMEEAVNMKLDLRELKLQYQRQLEFNNRQQFFLKTLSICLNPVIILRLLQHRLFGCFNQLWYWTQNNNTNSSSHHPSICLSNSNQTALYHLLNTRANNSARSSFASTIGMDSFQAGLNSRSRASSATANSIILPNELFETNLRNRRNVSLTINCPLDQMSLSNLNSYTGGGSSSQRTSISVDRSSRQESYRKASVRSGSGDDQSSLYQSAPLSGLNLQPNLTKMQSTQNQDEIAEFQKQLQNIPKNECSPVAARNFVGLAVSSASNQLLINDTMNQQRRNTATLLPQSINVSMDNISVPNRPRSCSMPQQQQQLNVNSLQQHQQTANQIINQITNQINNLSSQDSSNQQLSTGYSTNYQTNAQNIQQIHNLSNQQLQALIKQQLHSQNLINQHLQSHFRSQNYTSQQQKDKQTNYQQTDQSTSQNNSLDDKISTLNTQGSLDSLNYNLTPLLFYRPQQRNFFDRSLSIAVPEPLIFQQTQFKQLIPSQRPQTSSNQSFALDASTQSNLNVNCSHSSVSSTANPPVGHFTNAGAGRLSFSLRSTSGGDVYSLLNNLASSTLSTYFETNYFRIMI